MRENLTGFHSGEPPLQKSRLLGEKIKDRNKKG